MGTGTLTTNEFIYLPKENARGEAEKALYDAGLQRVDTRLGRVIYVGDPKYPTLAAAVASLNAVGTSCTMILPAGTHTVSADLTVNSNIHLQALKGCSFAIATTKTLTINGTLDAGPYQIFSCTGTGKVVFGNGSVHESYPEWWGAAVGDSVDCYAAFAAALTAGVPIRCAYGTYKIVGSLSPIEGAIVGAGWGTAADAKRTILKFYNCTTTTTGAINTRIANYKNGSLRLENLYILASSWDGTTGCLGYGLDIEAPVICKNVYVQGFKKSNLWLHNDASGNGPYNSFFENVYSTYSGQHGCLVGYGANAVTFINFNGKWNGSPDGTTAPSGSDPHSYDGFSVQYTADGGGYYAYNPENITVIGGDCSYNSRYGWYFKAGVRSYLTPGYAEGNLVDGTGGMTQAAVGQNIGFSTINFAKLEPYQIAMVSTYAPSAVSIQMWAAGKYLSYGNNSDLSLSQRYQFLYASNNSDYVLGKPNNAAGQFALNTGALGSIRLGTGSAGVVEMSNNIVMLPYQNYQAIAAATNISEVTNVSGTLIRLTVGSAPATDSRVYVQGCIVCPAANGIWFVTNIDATHIDLVGSTYALIAERADSTSYSFGANVRWATGTTIWQSQTPASGTTASSPPDITGKVVGDYVVDGGVVWRMVDNDYAAGSAQACIIQTYSTSSYPTSGTSAKGDIHWSNAPSAGGTAGWRCTTAGANPGTAKFAPIALGAAVP